MSLTEPEIAEREALEALAQSEGWRIVSAFVQAGRAPEATLDHIARTLGGQDSAEVQRQAIRDVMVARAASLEVLKIPEVRLKKLSELAASREPVAMSPRRA
jgi:hypothetical protein